MPITLVRQVVYSCTDHDHDQRSNQLELWLCVTWIFSLHMDNDDDDDETDVLLLLANSNIPTGSFVDSAGPEPLDIGFLPKDLSTIGFVQDSLVSYAQCSYGTPVRL